MKTLKQMLVDLDNNPVFEMFFIKLIAKMIKLARKFDDEGLIEYEMMYRLKFDEEYRLSERRIKIIEKELSKTTLAA
jgi:hypothetical protein